MAKQSLEQRVSQLEDSVAARPEQELRIEALRYAAMSANHIGVDVTALAAKHLEFLLSK